MIRKLLTIVLVVLLLVASVFGFLIFISGFSGHPPEWILDAYYSIFPSTAVAGVIALIVAIGIMSVLLFGLALSLILNRRRSRNAPGV